MLESTIHLVHNQCLQLLAQSKYQLDSLTCTHKQESQLWPVIHPTIRADAGEGSPDSSSHNYASGHWQTARLRARLCVVHYKPNILRIPANMQSDANWYILTQIAAHNHTVVKSQSHWMTVTQGPTPLAAKSRPARKRIRNNMLNQVTHTSECHLTSRVMYIPQTAVEDIRQTACQPDNQTIVKKCTQSKQKMQNAILPASFMINKFKAYQSLLCYPPQPFDRSQASSYGRSSMPYPLLNMRCSYAGIVMLLHQQSGCRVNAFPTATSYK